MPVKISIARDRIGVDGGSRRGIGRRATAIAIASTIAFAQCSQPSQPSSDDDQSGNNRDGDASLGAKEGNLVGDPGPEACLHRSSGTGGGRGRLLCMCCGLGHCMDGTAV